MSDNFITRRDILFLASKGYYALAQEAEDARRRHLAEEALSRKQELLKQQELEWKIFLEARRQHLEDARMLAAMENLKSKESLHRKYGELCKAHEEEMEVYTERVKLDTARLSVALPPLFTMARAAESRLASAGLYNEAAMAQTMFYELEQSEREAAKEKKRDIMKRKLRHKQENLDLRNISSYQNVLIAQELNSLSTLQRIQETEANLKHKADQMAAAHYKQRKALELPLLVPRVSSKAQTILATRGTQLKKKVHGDHYYVPSLCSMYGSLLERE